MVGRGAGDMKSGLAMATLAIEALLAADPGAQPPVTVVGAIEEEQSGQRHAGLDPGRASWARRRCSSSRPTCAS